MHRISARLLFALLSLSACAAIGKEAHPVVSSMLVTGTITLSPDGGVDSYALDKADQLPTAVSDVVRTTVPGWYFQLDIKRGEAAKAKMTLRVVATPVDDQHVSIVVAGAQFGNDAPAETVTYKSMSPPQYPYRALKELASGTVYVLLRVGRDGSVANAAAEQVDLTSPVPVFEMEVMRKDLAAAALKAVSRWTFNLPTVGASAAAPYWDARVPIIFQLVAAGNAPPVAQYGHWQPYLPGPHHAVSWRDDSGGDASGAADVVADGDLQQLGAGGPRLSTPLSGA